ncbi:hypothetical protein [Burkholderia paludis]|uniref:hypothetical protein n=1 Tax=Burkholderia paludis TaxID=1506587 RepID=UPI001269DA0A|nr:hypothetical protein [Burkholderia paludis]
MSTTLPEPFDGKNRVPARAAMRRRIRIHTARWLRHFVFRNNAAIAEKYKPIFLVTRLKATPTSHDATHRENT